MSEVKVDEEFGKKAEDTNITPEDSVPIKKDVLPDTQDGSLKIPEDNNDGTSDQTSNDEEKIKKSMEVQREKKNKQTAALSNITKKRNAIVDLMRNVDNLNSVKTALNELDDRYAAYKKAHEEHIAVLMDDAVIENEESRFSSKQTSIVEFRRQISAWIRSAEQEMADDLDEASSSMKSRKRLENRSQKSGSHRSMKSIHSARLMEKAKIAELSVMKAMLKQQQEVSRKRQQIKDEEQRVKLELELAMAKARVEAFATEEEADGMNLYLEEETRQQESRDVQPSNLLPDVREPDVPKLDARVSDVRKPDARGPGVLKSDVRGAESSKPDARVLDVSSSELDQVKTAQKLDVPVVRSPFNLDAPPFYPRNIEGMDSGNLLAALTLPPCKLTTFKGELSEYRTFIRTFETRIASKVSSANEKLDYLLQHLEGDAKSMVEACIDIEDAEQGYTEACRLLEREYGDVYKLSLTYLKKIHDWPLVKADDGVGLKRLAMYLVKCETVMKSVTYLDVLNHPPNMVNIVQKLPGYLQNKWRESASKARMERQMILNFSDLVNFVRSAAETANDPVYGRTSSQPLVDGKRNQGQTKPKQKSSSFATGTVSTNDTVSDVKDASVTCVLCSGQHDLEVCNDYMRKTVEDKREFLKTKGLCFGCFGRNHLSKDCKRRRKCSKCAKRHPTSLHIDGYEHKLTLNSPGGREEEKSMPSGTKSKIDSSSCTATDVEDSLILHAILPVKIRQEGRKECVSTYAFYDNGSSGCFITEDLMRQLHASGRSTVLQLKTMHGCTRSGSNVINNLVVSDMDGSNVVHLPSTFTREEIPVTKKQIPRIGIVSRWKNLQGIVNEMSDYRDDLEIGILIGRNCPVALEPLQVVPSDGRSPYAVRLRHGWTIHGPLQVESDCQGKLVVNRIMVQEVEAHKEILSPSSILHMFEMDFNEHCAEVYPGEKGMSQEDQRFLKMCENGIVMENGHFTLP